MRERGVSYRVAPASRDLKRGSRIHLRVKRILNMRSYPLQTAILSIFYAQADEIDQIKRKYFYCTSGILVPLEEGQGIRHRVSLGGPRSLGSASVASVTRTPDGAQRLHVLRRILVAFDSGFSGSS